MKPTSVTSAGHDVWLVAHDLTVLGDQAAKEAARLAAPAGAKVALLHVHGVPNRNPYERTGTETFAFDEEIRRRLRGLGDQLIAGNPGLRVDVEVLAGNPRERILEEAERLDATHIVVGTHDRKGLARLVLGSVAESVVHAARVPVLVVRNADERPV
jgi:nucleotide-binding universal stress UspA family protein